MTTCRTNSRKSALNFTSKRQRRVRKLVRHPDRKRKRVPAPNKGQALAVAEGTATTATSSMRNSKSWTKTRRNRQTICRLGSKRMFRAGRLNPKNRNKNRNTMATVNVRPLGDRVLVQPIEEQEVK